VKTDSVFDSYYLDLISGRRNGWFALLLRAVLWCGVPLYWMGVRFRNMLYRIGLKRTHRVSVPVISVGNLTTGGTGKTPMVAWLVQQLIDAQHRPAIVSRGYRSLDESGNDEKRLLDAMLPGVCHIQSRDRVAASQEAISQSDCDVIVLDDGFQHRRLARDLDIVLIDAMNPWGHGAMLPRGLMRESRSALRRADLLVMTRCDAVDAERLQILKAELEAVSNAPVIASAFEPNRLVNSSGKVMAIESAHEFRIVGCCGIGNPHSFRRTLASIGAPVSDDRLYVFPDHFHYGESDIHKLKQWALERSAEAIFVTRKDLVKLNVDRIGRIPVWAVDIELRFFDEEETVTAFLERVTHQADTD